MDYEKIVFSPKTEISHFDADSFEEQNTSSAQNFLSPLDAYASYADNFDLSLLPNESELVSRPAQAASPCNASLDYIPTTIYHDRDNNPIAVASQIKTEHNWSEPHNSSRSGQHDPTIISNKFQKQPYPYSPYIYPSPQSSPSQNDYSQLNVPCTTITSSIPSPSSSSNENISTNQIAIKQEIHILPPSPPESNCEALSPHSFTEIKSEPLDSDVEKLIDISSFLEKSLKELERTKKSISGDITGHQPQDHQLLREYLEDTSFQRKHNLKPLVLEPLIGGLGVRSDIEPVISLALEHAKRDAEETCIKLQISPDPKKWSPTQVQAWIRFTIEQFNLPTIIDLELKFPEDGTTLASLTEEEFIRRAPEIGATIHAQLEIWNLAYSGNFNTMIGDQRDIPPMNDVQNEKNNLHPENMEVNKSDDNFDNSQQNDMKMNIDQSDKNKFNENLPTPAASTRTPGSSHIHLWQFLKELLSSPQVNGTAIRWIDRSKGVFKIEDSVRVAKLWGRRKNRPAMNYDKLSRSIRQYYKKGIMKKTERSQRLVYQFCHPYSL